MLGSAVQEARPARSRHPQPLGRPAWRQGLRKSLEFGDLLAVQKPAPTQAGAGDSCGRGLLPSTPRVCVSPGRSPGPTAAHPPSSPAPSQGLQVSDTGTQQGWAAGVRAERAQGRPRPEPPPTVGQWGNRSPFPEFWREPGPLDGWPQVPAQADPRPAFKGMQSGQGGDPVLESPPRLVSCSPVSVLRFLIASKHRTAHFNLALGPQNNDTSLVSPDTRPLPHHPLAHAAAARLITSREFWGEA